MASSRWRHSRVLVIALLSRITIVALAICLHSVPYDTSSELDTKCMSSRTSGIRPPTSVTLQEQPKTGVLDRYITWDSVHFVRIAQCGYEYEQSFAFFPALPLLMRALSSTFLWPFSNFVGWRGTLWLSGLLVSNCTFIAAAGYLYRLGLVALRDEELAFHAAVLFCWNPASIFYSSVYTESLFAFASFAGLLYMLRRNRGASLLLLSASTAVRSNGILHAYFFLFEAAETASARSRERTRLKATRKDEKGPKRPVSAIPLSGPFAAILELLKGLVWSGLVCTPFALFQWYGYQQACLKGDHPQPWCHARVPYIYGYVQDRYWNVGFLRYFRLKQLPNFLLASPMLALSLGALWAYARHDRGRFLARHLWPVFGGEPRENWADLTDAENSTPGSDRKGGTSYRPIPGLRPGVPKPGVPETGGVTGRGPRGLEEVRSVGGELQDGKRPGVRPGEGEPGRGNGGPETGFYSPVVLCFAHQLAAMVVVATLVMHVQVATRFLSASPVVYWYAATLCRKAAQTQGKREQGKGGGFARKCGGIHRWIWGAFVGYSVVGTLLFTNFYPFT